MEFPSLRTVVLDSLPVNSNYHVSWSPDSRFLAADRATSVDHHGNIMGSELMLFDDRMHRCMLTQTRDIVETEPKWVDGARIRYTIEPPVGEEEVRVLELVPAGRKTAKQGGPS